MNLSALDIRPFARCPHGNSTVSFDFQCFECFDPRDKTSTQHILDQTQLFDPANPARGGFEFNGLVESYAWLNPQSQVLELHTTSAAGVESLEAFVRHVDQILLAMIHRTQSRLEELRSVDNFAYMNARRSPPTIEFRPETHPACIVAIVRTFMFPDSACGGRTRFGQIICHTIHQAAAATFATVIDDRRACKPYREPSTQNINNPHTPVVTYVSVQSPDTKPWNVAPHGDHYPANLPELVLLAKQTGLYEHVSYTTDAPSAYAACSAATPAPAEGVHGEPDPNDRARRISYTDRRFFRLKFPSMDHLKAAAIELDFGTMALKDRLEILLGAFTCLLGDVATSDDGMHVPSCGTAQKGEASTHVMPAYYAEALPPPRAHDHEEDTHRARPMPSSRYFAFGAL